MRLLRPRSPSSSAMTRSALSEAMKFTLSIRGSQSTAYRKCFRNNEPLAPVVATVRFCGERFGNVVPCISILLRRSLLRLNGAAGVLSIGRPSKASQAAAGDESLARFANDERPKRNDQFMATSTNLGFRRNAGQMHALARVERELRANDGSGRRKYLQDFTNAFRSYDAVLDRQ